MTVSAGSDLDSDGPKTFSLPLIEDDLRGKEWRLGVLRHPQGRNLGPLGCSCNAGTRGADRAMVCKCESFSGAKVQCQAQVDK